MRYVAVGKGEMDTNKYEGRRTNAFLERLELIREHLPVPFQEHNFFYKIYNTCESYKSRVDDDTYDKKCRESKKQRLDLIDSANELKSKIAPPFFSFSTRGDLYIDAVWHLNKCIENLGALSAAIEDEFQENSKKRKRSAKYDLIWWLAIEFEKARAIMHNIEPDLLKLPFANKGNTESGQKYQRYYHGDFFKLVYHIWWALGLGNDQIMAEDGPDAIRYRYNLGRLIERALGASRS